MASDGGNGEADRVPLVVEVEEMVMVEEVDLDIPMVLL